MSANDHVVVDDNTVVTGTLITPPRYEISEEELAIAKQFARARADAVSAARGSAIQSCSETMTRHFARERGVIIESLRQYAINRLADVVEALIKVGADERYIKIVARFVDNEARLEDYYGVAHRESDPPRMLIDSEWIGARGEGEEF